MADKLALGDRIKRFRLGRNLTLKEVELKAKVSATHISEIERGMTSPTVGALTKIARALGTEPSYFLQSDDTPPVSVVRRANRRVLSDEAWGATLNRLCSGIRGSEMSLLEIELEPGRDEKFEPIIHSGEEFLYVMKGVVEVYIGLERHLVKEGDSLHFRLNEPHALRNIGDGVAKLLWATLPPFYL
jgi:transcriptional regulator with XRE-family HTH domain